MSQYTCINCCVKFKDAEFQREHYKTDWHRYNLKRRVAELPPVTAEEFAKRVIQQRTDAETALFENQTTHYCEICRKTFSTQNAYDNHLVSKKHKESMQKIEDSGVEPGPKPHRDAIDADSDGEFGSDEEWGDDNPIDDNNCLFCDTHSDDFVANLKHMSIVHSFFVPDLDYCVNLPGLLAYLGDKIAKDYMCIWCNEKGRTFYTLDACRKHMRDKGHTQMLHEGLALAEYADFYDYSSSYPVGEGEETMDVDEEIEAPPALDGDEYQLVLPSGAVIGHRSLMRYYKQRLNPNRTLVHKKSDKRLHKVLAEYRSLGWTTSEQQSAVKKARDIHFMKRTQNKWQMKLSCKANKLQHHYREQVNF